MSLAVSILFANFPFILLNIALMFFILLSQAPPWWLPAAGFVLNTISMKKNAFGTHKLVPWSLNSVETGPLMLSKPRRAYTKLLVGRSQRNSMWMYLEFRHAKTFLIGVPWPWMAPSVNSDVCEWGARFYSLFVKPANLLLFYNSSVFLTICAVSDK